MRIGTQRRLSLLVRVMVASMLLGMVYGALLNVAAYGGAGFGIPIGAMHGLILSAAIGSLEIFGSRSRPGRVIEQAPFTVTLLVKGLVYGSMVRLAHIREPRAPPLRTSRRAA